MREIMVDLDNPKDVADLLDRFVNGASREDIENFAKESAYCHLTLQQKKSGMFMKYFGYVKESPFEDLRNEGSRKVISEIVDKYSDTVKYGFSFI